MANVATPLLIGTEPIVVDPSLNATIPVMPEEPIVAVSVIPCPRFEGFLEVASAVVVFALLTMTVVGGQVLGR